ILLNITKASCFSTNPPNCQSATATSSLGADVMKQLVVDAAHDDTLKTLDVKGIMWMEHINLVVGSKPLAETFYFDLLGFSKDRSSSFHCNLGQQQFHLAETGDPAQRVTGSIGLVIPSLKNLRERVDVFKDVFSSTQFEIVQDEGDWMTVVCPWGNWLHLYDISMDSKLEKLSDSPQKMVQLHADGGSYAANRIGIRGNPGIRYIEIACRPGTATAIAKFYEEILECSVYTPKDDQAFISVGPGVHLGFVENENLSEQDIKAMEGVHICVYAHNFKGLYDRLKARGLIWTNPRFTHLDSCDTWEETNASRTLRFKDIIDLGTGEKVLELEHETRALRHGQYMKVPFYEPK
ncbi:unnamed protein product, partial [Heterosigma akashiwo]